ncbi:MAG TPA: hypothetical protein VJ385_19085 [Fibrobacteria bacterium]|nr:hypothetical protein [Fibrobacteria bacterium]
MKATVRLEAARETETNNPIKNPVIAFMSQLLVMDVTKSNPLILVIGIKEEIDTHKPYIHRKKFRPP